MNPIHVAAGALAGIVVGYIAGRFLPAGSKKNNRKSSGRKDNAQRGQDNRETHGLAQGNDPCIC